MYVKKYNMMLWLLNVGEVNIPSVGMLGNFYEGQIRKVLGYFFDTMI